MQVSGLSKKSGRGAVFEGSAGELKLLGSTHVQGSNFSIAAEVTKEKIVAAKQQLHKLEGPKNLIGFLEPLNIMLGLANQLRGSGERY